MGRNLYGGMLGQEKGLCAGNLVDIYLANATLLDLEIYPTFPNCYVLPILSIKYPKFPEKHGPA